jgi:hypothetical protein
MLENGTHATIKEIAAAEAINESYIARVLRLTLLAPEIVEEILEGRQSCEITLAPLMRSFPVGWAKQRRLKPCAIASAASVWSRMRASVGCIRRPNSERKSWFRSRRKSGLPRCDSSFLIAVVSAGCDTWQSSAARVKFNVCAAARK